MSNAAFDKLCIRQDLANAKATLANMQAAAQGDTTAAERDYLSRAIPAEQRRIEELTRMAGWGF